MRDEHNILFDSSISKISLVISNAAYNTNEAGWTVSDVNAPFSRIFFMEKGEATIEYSKGKFILTAGNVYILPCGLTFSGYSDVPHSKIYFLFNLRLPDGNDIFSITDEIMSAYVGEKEIRKIKELFFSKDIFDILMLKNTITEYALRLIPKESTSKLSSVVYSPIIQSVIDHIKANPSAQMTAESLSEILGVSATSLSKRFKKEVGITLGKFIDNAVFDVAKQMLVSSKYPIKQISDMLGFCDRFYFSRRFKSKFIITPYKYRIIKTTTFDK